MANEVFTLEEAGAYFNPRFVAVKYDIENEPEGKELARKHAVRAIPTFLVFRSDGTLMHKVVGAADLDKFIDRVEESFSADRAYGIVRRMYDEGRGDREFLTACIDSFSRAGDPDVGNVCRQLTAQLTDEEKTAPEYWFIYASDVLTPPRSEGEKFLLTHYDAFRRNGNADEVNNELAKRYKLRLLDIITLKDSISPNDLRTLTAHIEALQLPRPELKVISSIATEVVCGNFDSLIDLCEVSLPGLNEAVNRYFELLDRFMHRGTRAQRLRWIEVGERILPTAPANMQSMLTAVIKYQRDKLPEA
jgi:hypothetical protein